MDHGVTELLIDHARPFAEVTIGSDRGAIAWLDTGGGPVIVGRRLADELGVVEFEDTVDGQRLLRVELPPIDIGGASLLTEPYVARRNQEDLITGGFAAELFIPAHVLAAHTVVFDYPARRLELHPPNEPTGRGVPVACPFHRRPGWPAVHAQIDDSLVPLLVDTGASCCMLSLPEFERLTADLPPERKAIGAVGVANMSGGPWEATVPIARLRAMTIGPLTVPDVVVVGRPKGNFEGMMSGGTAIPVVGAVSGNVLRWGRIELYASPNTACIQPVDEPQGDDMTLVPLVLQSTQQGPVVHGVASREGKPMVTGVAGGDVLESVDGTTTDGLGFAAVVDLLRGLEGQRKRLRLDRGGAHVEVDTDVVSVV